MKKGFTLVEVMAATCVLALGIVMIYEAFFISWDHFKYCSNYLRVSSWADEKMWLAEDSITRLGGAAQIEPSGDFVIKNRSFSWDMSYSLIDDRESLYSVNLDLTWREGKKEETITRTAYAAFKKEE